MAQKAAQPFFVVRFRMVIPQLQSNAVMGDVLSNVPVRGTTRLGAAARRAQSRQLHRAYGGMRLDSVPQPVRGKDYGTAQHHDDSAGWNQHHQHQGFRARAGATEGSVTPW